jgi:hypothetical protein
VAALLRSDETVLVGRWEATPAGVVADEVAKRIKSLVAYSLVKVATDDSGWDTLYRDPNDQRFWELTYPQSEMHGGGPPKLEHITTENALRKYPGLGL